MRTIREWVGDRRVAGALAGVAILLVGYRFYSTVAGRPAEKAMPPVSAVEQAAQEPEKILPEAAVRTPPPPGKTIRWSWDRNPFLPADFSGASTGKSVV